MRKSIPIFASVAAAVALTAAVFATPATAEVTSVVGSGTTDVTVNYTLDSTDSVSNGHCEAGDGQPRYYTTATMTVSSTGSYYFEEPFGGTVDGDVNIYRGAAPNPLDGSCVGAMNSGRDNYLEAGVTYSLVMTTASPSATGSSAVRIFLGPGTVTVVPDAAGPTFEQAQAACVPGAAVPDGYTLKTGTAGNETLRGTEGKDLIRGLGGNDTIEGLGGDDILCGGAGNDTLRGGAGADFLFAEAGNDFSYGDAGDDVISGGLGNDLLNGGADTDTGLDTQGNNTFTSIESRTLEPAPNPQPTATANR